MVNIGDPIMSRGEGVKEARTSHAYSMYALNTSNIPSTVEATGKSQIVTGISKSYAFCITLSNACHGVMSAHN